jgi:hypothetical protein
VTYGALSGSAAVEQLTGDIQVKTSLDADGLRTQLKNARIAFWELHPQTPGRRAYAWVFELAVAVAAVSGIAAAVVRRRWAETRALVWVALAWPAAFMTLVAIVYGVFGGLGTAAGRHYYAALVPVTILIALGAVLVAGRRFALPLVLALLAFAGFQESRIVDNYADAVYTSGIVGNDLAPVVEQTWGDREVIVGRINFISPCAVAVIGIYSATPPQTVSVRIGERVLVAEGEPGPDSFTNYRLPEPVTGEGSIIMSSRPYVAMSDDEREAAFAVPGEPGDPAARLYCSVDDPKSVRFEQRHSIQHPDAPYTLAAVSLWPKLWGWAWALSAIVAGAWAIRDLLGSRRGVDGARDDVDTTSAV